MGQVKYPLDEKKPTSDVKPKTTAEGGELPPNSAAEFFQKVLPEMKRIKPSDESVAAAMQALERLERQAVARGEQGDGGAVAGEGGARCAACGGGNAVGQRFCGACGSPLAAASAAQPSGQHHYHHHYHHIAGGGEGLLQALAGAGAGKKEGNRVAGTGTSATPGGLSRHEAAIRRLVHDWVVACNMKHLDDLVDLYAADALVLRSNYPPVRGGAAIREFFTSVLDAGLGEVEMDPLRVLVVGDIAFEAGRCKMLAPVSVGKRREERAKYVMIFARQSNGEWKAVVDCWASDLSLKAGTETEVTQATQAVGSPVRVPRRSA
jgi:uncharacterized protein (TIGR02246 family)